VASESPFNVRSSAFGQVLIHLLGELIP